MVADSRSVLTRSARPPDRTVRYGRLPDHLADVWLPAEPGRTSLVIFLHGGFWRAEYDRTHAAPLAAALADAGYPVATPEYRRTAAGWPEAWADVQAAVAAVPARVGHHGPVLLMGHSAGGQLALVAASQHAAATVGVVALAPVADLRAGYEQRLGGGAVADLLGGGPDEVPDAYAEADPMARLPVGVPVVLVHGQLDRQVPVSFSQRYAAAGRAAGDAVRLDLLPGTDHFAVIDPESAAWPAVLAALASVSGPDAGR